MVKETLINQINQGYSTWKLAELNNTTQPNIRYWLKKYNLKTQRADDIISNTRKCLTCKITQCVDSFYKRGNKYMSHCKICYQKNYSQKSKNNKQKAVSYLGGKCSNCGYNKCNAALDFHHINPNIKEIEISQLLKGNFNSRLISELNKCILLCANCHREHHSS